MLKRLFNKPSTTTTTRTEDKENSSSDSSFTKNSVSNISGAKEKTKQSTAGNNCDDAKVGSNDDGWEGITCNDGGEDMSVAYGNVNNGNNSSPPTDRQKEYIQMLQERNR